MACLILIIAAGVYALASGRVAILTPDQKAYRNFTQGDYATAADTFADPMWKGIALFKQGEFEDSAGVFAGFDTANGTFNRGNALLLHGKYEDAAKSYARALELRPGWEDATINRRIALARAEMLKTEGGDMTGGMVDADDIVFDKGKAPPSAGEEQTDGGQPMSDAEINAVWLRHVQTKPADFLSAKFAYQIAKREAADTDPRQSSE